MSMKPAEQLGYDRMLEAINGGEDIAAFINDLAKSRSRNPELFGGAISCLIVIYHSGRDHGGVIPETPDPEQSRILKCSQVEACFTLTRTLNSGEIDVLNRQLSALIAAVNQMRKHWHWPVSRVQDTKPEVIDVRVVSMPPSAPAKVEVLSMPTRTTTISVQRDKTGKAVGAIHTETDCHT